MSPRGKDISVRGFISKTGVPLYFDDDGNYRPEGPKTTSAQSNKNSEDTVCDTSMHPLYFITANVKIMHVTSV